MFNEGYFFMGWLIFKRCLFISQFIWDRGGVYIWQIKTLVLEHKDNRILILPDITLDLCSPRSIFFFKGLLVQASLVWLFGSQSA